MSGSDRWLARLQTPTPVIIDGATGTRLEALGVDVRHPLWGSRALLTAEGRALTAQVHRAYVEAGAELVIANTHNLSFDHVVRYTRTLAEPPDPTLQTVRLNTEAVALARDAVPSAMVAGCLASPDRPYATRASLTAHQVAVALAAQYDALRSAAPDVIIFEMLTTASDLDGVAQLVGPPTARTTPVALGLVAGDEGTLGGVPWAQAWRRVAAVAPSAVFIQCTSVPRVAPALRSLVELTDGAVALGVYANDGGYDEQSQAWTGPRLSPAAYAAAAQHWVAAGARIVGGCCGTGPDHIRAVDRALRDGGP